MNEDHRAEMEALQRELEAANDDLVMTEEESKKIKVERDMVEEQLAARRGEARVKAEPVD